MYSIIYADPPWWYNPRNNPNTRFGRGIHAHYKPMKTEDICAMPVGDLGADDSVLLMWCTTPRNFDGHLVMQAWGYRFVNFAFVWEKIDKDGNPRTLPGYYTASNIEYVMLGVRGSMKPRVRLVNQIIRWPVPKVHSMKPPQTRERIVRAFGDKPRVELFARQETPGWDLHGDQCPGQTIKFEEERKCQ